MQNASLAVKALIRNLKNGSLAEMRCNDHAAALVFQSALREHGFKAKACESNLVVKNAVRKTIASIPLVSLHFKQSATGAALQDWIVVDLTGVSSTPAIMNKALKKVFGDAKKPWGTIVKMEPWRQMSDEFLDPVHNPVISQLVETWSSVAKETITAAFEEASERKKTATHPQIAN